MKHDLQIIERLRYRLACWLYGANIGHAVLNAYQEGHRNGYKMAQKKLGKTVRQDNTK